MLGFLIAQGVDALSGGAGWIGAGLLGLVLAWVFLRHLPDKDRQLKELIDGKDAIVRELATRHSDAVKIVVNNCQDEAKLERETSERRHAEAMAVLNRINETGREALHATRNLGSTFNLRTRLADALQSTEAPASTKHLDGTLTSWNVACEGLLGWKQGEVVGRSIFETIIPKSKHAEEESVLERIAAGESISEYETQRIHKSGRLVSLLVITNPIRNRDGKVIGASTIAREV